MENQERLLSNTAGAGMISQLPHTPIGMNDISFSQEQIQAKDEALKETSREMLRGGGIKLSLF